MGNVASVGGSFAGSNTRILKLPNVGINQCLATLGVCAVRLAVGRNAEGVIIGIFDIVSATLTDDLAGFSVFCTPAPTPRSPLYLLH